MSKPVGKPLRGKGKVSPFLMIPRLAYDSDSFRGLSAHAVQLYLCLIRQHTGKNNGDLCTAQKILQDFGLVMDRKTVTASREELIEAGFISVTRQGFRGGDGGKYPTLVRLTYEYCAKNEAKGIADISASHEYKDRTPPEGGWRKLVLARQKARAGGAE